MSKQLKIRMKQDCDSFINNTIYHKNEILKVVELEGFPNSYARYYIKHFGEHVDVNMLDWIPKDLCLIVNTKTK